MPQVRLPPIDIQRIQQVDSNNFNPGQQLKDTNNKRSIYKPFPPLTTVETSTVGTQDSHLENKKY